ncbi:MAG: amino acid ABC transporter ATP-binding protein [Catenisphaera adipataccumulans]|jgi:ABC-type polar amino acid transport system ATPase subunit|uniref:amino acid ABC transporter ATP-binding protein n=1 Tax=Catenisphaera adipataccumulans TaxID=700500 RepID=UPI003D8CC6DF
MIQLKQITKSFGSHRILKGIDLQVEDGQTLAIIGPSGSGKSTLLRCLNLLEKPDGGIVQIGAHRYDSSHITKEEMLEFRRATAMVFQGFNLFANQSVINNIILPLRVRKKCDKEKGREIALRLLKQVGLADKADAYPNQLSGGQQQRVAIARALALQPEVILFDEPTSALDPELVNGVLDVIRSIRSETMIKIIVTHEMSFARDAADAVIFLEDGQIIEQGSAHEVFDHPKQERTKKFLQNFQRA